MTVEGEVQDRTITLNGLQFHYRDWGNTGAQPLVLLHGYTSHARTFDTLAGAMRDRYHVLALDQRGHGETAWAPEYEPEHGPSDVAAFVRQLSLGHIALLGHSMGGNNAFRYAGSPAGAEAVDRLIIVDIGPEIVGEGLARIMGGAQAPDLFDDPEEPYRLARAANPRADDTELRHRIRNSIMPTGDGHWTWRYDKALRSPDRPVLPQNPDELWEIFKRISCPTLIIRGEFSDILSPEVAERMVQELVDCRLVTIPNAGHSVPLDNPQGFVQAVQSFL